MTGRREFNGRRVPAARIAAWILLAVWAVLWTFFSIAEMLSGEPGAWSHAVFPILPIAVFVTLTIARPRIGAVALIGAGVVGVLYLDHAMTSLTLAAPPVVIGVLLLFGRRS